MNPIRRALVAAIALAPLASLGQPRFNYSELKPPQPVETQGKIEVIEFFWYGCIHCYNLEPALETWTKKLPPDVAFRRIPAVFNERWAHDAAIFYTLESMGLLEKLHRPLFDAIHRLLHAVDDAFIAATAPARTSAIEQRGRFLRRLVHHRNRGGFETFGRHRPWFDAGADLAKQAQAVFFLLLLMPPVHTNERDDALHVVGVRVTGRGLVHEARFFDAGLRSNCEHHRSHLIDRRDVEVHHDGFLVTAHHDAGQRLVGAGIDFLVGSERRDVDEVSWTGLGDVFQSVAPTHACPAPDDVDHAFQFAVVVRPGLGTRMDRRSAGPDLFRPSRGPTDCRLAVHAGCLGGVGVQLVVAHDADPPITPIPGFTHGKPPECHFAPHRTQAPSPLRGV